MPSVFSDPWHKINQRLNARDCDQQINALKNNGGHKYMTVPHEIFHRASKFLLFRCSITACIAKLQLLSVSIAVNSGHGLEPMEAYALVTKKKLNSDKSTRPDS